MIVNDLFRTQPTERNDNDTETVETPNNAISNRVSSLLTFQHRATSDATIGRYANRTGINSSVSVGDFAHSSAPLLRSSSFLSFPPPNSQGAFPSAASVMLTSPPSTSLDSSLGPATQTLKMEGILWMIKESIEAIRKKMKIPFSPRAIAHLHVIHSEIELSQRTLGDPSDITTNVSGNLGKCVSFS